MTDPNDNLHHYWQHAWAFGVYEEQRAPVAPAIERLVQPYLAEYVANGGIILEVGAGGGALRKYAGSMGGRYTWIESDHNPDFLTLPRKHASTLLQLTLPDLSAARTSPDAIVGLGVFDTLSLAILRATAEASQKQLSEQGVVMHWLDMSPDYSIDIRINADQGLFPIPFSNAQGQTGIHYLELDGLMTRINHLPLNRDVKAAFIALIADPQKTLPHFNRTAVLPYLGRLAEEHGMVVKTDQNWMEVLAERCKAAWEAAGFIIVKNEVIASTIMQKKRKVDPRYQNATHIRRQQGVIKISDDEDVPTGKVKLSADAHLFVAKKSI